MGILFPWVLSDFAITLLRSEIQNIVSGIYSLHIVIKEQLVVFAKPLNFYFDSLRIQGKGHL